jgi:hypothetical protein
MRRLILATVVAVALSSGASVPAKADNTETLAKTFALTLGGTIVGAYALPYIVPLAAPAVSTAYTAVVGTALDGVSAVVAEYVVLEPRMIGAITGMTAGLVGGLYFFSEEEEEVDAEAIAKATSNTAIKLTR